MDDQSYEGCELFAVDLDHGVSGAIDGSQQQFAVIVSNPGLYPAHVVVEVNDASFGEAIVTQVVAEADVPAGELTTFELPRREVDGSSASGRNDGTHTALSSNAFRIRSSVPVIAYQFNPLQNEGMFSADASLLLPTAALGSRTTVSGWPQSIGPGPLGEPSDQLRSFLTIVGTAPGTMVTVRLGDHVRRVAGTGTVPASRAGDSFTLTLGPFDVLNLETDQRLGDFSGTVVESTGPVAVFTGSEATDVPVLDDPAYRVHAADHIEEQLPPDTALGSAYVVARQPSRTLALATAMTTDPVPVVDEPEWLRVVSAEDSRDVRVRTSLAPPLDEIVLRPREIATLRLDDDALLDADGRISVLQLIAGQQLTGIPFGLPGGDPAALFVPAVHQLRRSHVFLVPSRFSFDFVVIVAPAGATVTLDGRALSAAGCEAGTIGVLRGVSYVAHRCQLSFPSIEGGPPVVIEPRVQGDGVHRVQSDMPVGVAVSGFDSYISYAYPGGMSVTPVL